MWNMYIWRKCYKNFFGCNSLGAHIIQAVSKYIWICTSYDKVKELTSFQNSNMYLHKPAQSCFLGPFLRIWEKAVCFLGYLLRIWEESMKISNPWVIREKRPSSRCLLVNPGELVTILSFISQFMIEFLLPFTGL